MTCNIRLRLEGLHTHTHTHTHTRAHTYHLPQMQFVVSNRIVANRLGRCEVHRKLTFLNKWRNFYQWWWEEHECCYEVCGGKYYRIWRLWRIITVCKLKIRSRICGVCMCIYQPLAVLDVFGLTPTLRWDLLRVWLAATGVYLWQTVHI